MIPKPYLSILGLAIFLFSTMFAQSGETQAELEARLASIEKSEELLQKEIEGYSPPNNEQAHERNLARFETQAALFEKQKYRFSSCQRISKPFRSSLGESPHGLRLCSQRLGVPLIK